MLELGMCEICGVRGIFETLGTVMCLRDGKQQGYVLYMLSLGYI